ncbi:type II toxin-antitoxin system tRNA(fMet)-specific endonuclease VapC [Pelistega europaea]|uniref:Ribonuclease VapC n=1 Tax=Pelistega europaea TaxID=106147 RepID=A0A7Y4L9C5_9BURK|nr:type II toxin-antitoxin system VapC family toxin [Pelistega europaea]NOL49399.1 type II toxin-antitoxin system VapC family toxin [Pelistega europaea]
MYILDTNICIYIINHRPAHVFERFQQVDFGNLCLSSITACELAFGVTKSGSTRNKQALQNFLFPLTVLPLDDGVIWEYADIRSQLEKKEQLIGSLDMLIAAHARSLGFTLVSNNVKEFEGIPNLKLENWV